jgi:hypothetical protein
VHLSLNGRKYQNLLEILFALKMLHLLQIVKRFSLVDGFKVCQVSSVYF